MALDNMVLAENPIDWLINVGLTDKIGTYALHFEDGKITQILPMAQFKQANFDHVKIIDGLGGLAIPPIVDSHLHYDSALTAGTPRWNQSGTLLEGIQCNGDRQKSADEADYLARAEQAIHWQIIQGVQFARIHADVSQPELTSLKAMLKLKQKVKDLINIEVVAFPQLGIMGNPRHFELFEEAIKLGADGIGGIPHFELSREEGVQSIQKIFDLAEQHHKFIDIHCDETDDEQARFVEVVATEALKRDMGQVTSASHVTALHSYNNAYAAKVINLISRAKINVVSNPITNIALQGRFDNYPIRRGVTRIKPLLEAGVNVSLGQDNLVDAFYPMGTGGMLPVLSMALHACHMLGSDDINSAMDLITRNGAKTLRLAESEYGIDVGKSANLVVMQAPNVAETIRVQSPILYNIRSAKLLASVEPLKAQIYLKNDQQPVSFFRQ